MSNNIRTYKLTHCANKGKYFKVHAVLKQYRICCTKIATRQWRLFYYGIRFTKDEDLWYVENPLSERYKRNCAYQVDASLKSFISNRKNEFERKVCKSSIDEELQQILLHINNSEAWYAPEHKLFTKEQLWLARKIFKHILDKNRKPHFRKANMLLNENVAKIIPVDKTKTIGFDYWIKLSTLEKRKPIMIPVLSNERFNITEGKLKNAVQFNFNKEGDMTIAFMKEIPKKEIKFKTDEVNLDFGLKVLFANHDGNLFGRKFYRVLLKYDKNISELMTNLQKQKIKPSTSTRYNNLVRKLRAYIKNEINRVLNVIINLYNPKKVTLENLNFKDSHLSKILNRLLRNCGRSVIAEKCVTLEKIYGIKIKEISAAYTSQECSNCHYVDKKNRIKQEIFRCKHCRLTINADVNAARINRYRSSMPEFANIYITRNQVLNKIVTLFIKRNPRLNSKANTLLSENPYFKDALAKQVKQAA